MQKPKLFAAGVAVAAGVAASGVYVATALPAARVSAAPSGLTSYGRTVWNLDALLHDTFGSRPVYLSIPQNFPRASRNFSTVAGANCCSGYYLSTFASARHSAFKTTGPTKPPVPVIGASGSETPLKIKGAFIYCGGGKWLFEHYGNGPANWQVSCHR
jgi:hypothetical protein